MKKSIFLFFAAILCAIGVQANTKFTAGEMLFYDFTAITGGANWSWNGGTDLAYDANCGGTIKAVIFTADETWNTGKTIAKSDKGGWANITFKDRTAGTNCIKIGADGKSYTWTTHSIEEDILSGNYIMVYGGELNSWGQSEYWFLTEANDERKAAVAKTKLSITINSEAYKMGPVLLPAGSTSYIQGHWNSGMKCSVEAGSAYVVRNSTTKTNYTQKAKSGSDYLYQVKQNATAPTKTLSPTCPTKILQGEKLSFSHGAAGVSVVGKTNTVKYYLQNGTTYTEKTLTDGAIDVSDLPAGNYSIITLLYDGYIYVKASTSNFTIESAYDVTFANDGNGTTNQTGTIKVGSSTGIVIDATPSTDYEFKAWESSNGGSFATTAADASNTFYPTANTTLTATFRSTAVNALLVVAGENITSVTGSAEPVTLGNSYPISATFPAGYKFTTWTAEPAANATFADAASATTDVTVLNGSVAVTASAEEVLSTLTTANEYNEGTPTIAAPTASVAKIGVTTTATVTAAAGTGYTFAGWKLDNCVRTDAGADNATTITVKSNGDGADAKVTAKYEQNVVYFVNTKGWSTVKVYAWNDGGASNAAWSGLALTATNVVKQIGGCDVYKYVPGDNYAKVIFNNGSEQTDDLTWKNGKYYVYNSENTKDVSDWYDESEVEGVLPDPVELKYTVEVPAGTHECYIAGDMNGWALTKMDPVDATHFTLTIQWATNAHKYKYAAGPDWKYEEVKADGSSVSDRTYSANDKVAKWKEVFDPTAKVYDYYIAGDESMTGYNWNPSGLGIEDTNADGVYSHVFTSLAAGTYNFRITDGTWSNTWGWSHLENNDFVELSAGDNDNNIKLTLTAAKTVTVNYHKTTKKVSIDGLTPVTYSDITIKAYTESAAPQIWWWNGGSKCPDADKTDNPSNPGNKYAWETAPTMTAVAGEANWYEYTFKDVNDYTGICFKFKSGDKSSSNFEGVKENKCYDARDIVNAKTTECGVTPSDCIECSGIYLKGTFNSWGTDNEFMKTADADVVTTTVTITQEGNYNFKVHATDWLGNDGGTMARGGSGVETGGWTMEKDKNEVTLAADMEGDYIFTYTISTKKLTITFPVVVPQSFPNQPTTLYFHPSSNWKKGNERYAAYIYNNGADKEWINLTDANSDGIYELANPQKYAKVIICRMDKTKAENKWENKWDQIESGIEIPNTATLNTCLAFWTNCEANVPVSECTWVAPTPLTDKNWGDFIAAYNGKTINAVVERSFKSGQYHTLCLPFDIPTNWLGEGTKAYQLTSIVANESDKLSLNATLWNTIVAGQPYIIVPVKGSEYEHVIINGVTVKNVSAGTNVASGDGYKATLKAVTATDGTKTNGSTEYYVGANDGKLYNAQTNKLGLRAIIELTTTGGQPLPAKVRAYVAAEENEATGFENIVAPEGQAMKVIENGQLIIIRGNEKFNAQGVRL